MSRWSLALFCTAVMLQFTRGEEPAFFGTTTIHRIHLNVSAKDYRAMDPPPVNLFAPRPKALEGRPAPGSPDAGAGNMLYEFEYVPAALEIDGHAFAKVGLRYKGSGSYMMSQNGAKRSLKIDFDRYDSQQRYRNLVKLNLNSGILDPTKAREILGFAVFRAAGVPAPRTALADVTLTVPGKFETECLGLYTVIEQVDKDFLKAHFGSGKGLLLKPEGIRGLPYLGDTKAAVEKAYNAKIDGDEADWKRLIELTRLVNKASEAEFRAAIRDYLDVDDFARFLAATSIIATLDSFIGLGHNYYIYLSPKTKKFHFMPWDLDLAFGGFFMFGTPDQQANFSIDHPHMGENKLIDRLLAMPEVKAAYRGHVERLHADLFASGRLARESEAIDTAAKELIAKEKKAAVARKEDFGQSHPFAPKPFPIAEFIRKRSDAVAAQLAGKSQGTIPGASFAAPPVPAGPGQQMAKPLLDLLDADKDGRVSEEEFAVGTKKLFAEWDRNKSGALEQRELAEGLQKLMPKR